MDKIMAMREKRAEMWEQAKQFLDEHEKDGRLTAEDAKAYEQMENEVLALGKDIERMERQAILAAQLAKPEPAALPNTGRRIRFRKDRACKRGISCGDAEGTAYELPSGGERPAGRCGCKRRLSRSRGIRSASH